MPYTSVPSDPSAKPIETDRSCALWRGSSTRWRADVVTAVRKIKNFKGVTGSIEFDNKGDPVKAKYFVLQFEKQAYPGKVVKVIEQQAPAAIAKKS